MVALLVGRGNKNKQNSRDGEMSASNEAKDRVRWARFQDFFTSHPE